MGEGTPDGQRVAIVGAGVLGLRLADVLVRGGHEVTLFEAADSLGGMASAWTLGEPPARVTWDRHYHVTLLSDSNTGELYRSFGVADDVEWTTTRTGYYGPDRVLRSVSSPREFLALPSLSLVDKFRIALTLAYGSTIRSGRRMERIGVDQWLRRWSGRNAYETFWRPLLRAKMSDAHPRASAAFIWATIRRLSAARRNGLDEEKFGYVRGGYARVLAAADASLRDRGVDVRLGTRVRSIHRGDVRPVVRSEPIVEGADSGGDDAQAVEDFDRVIVTTSSHVAAAMCPDLLPSERERLERVEYIGIVCVSMLLDRTLGGYYLTYITDPETPFTAVVEMTAFVDPDELGGRTLVYLPKYTDPDDPITGASDDEVLESFTTYLTTMYPDLEPRHVLAARVSRVREVFAVPTLRYSERAPSIGTSVPGLTIAGSAHLPFSTLNVNDTLSLVDDVLTEAHLS